MKELLLSVFTLPSAIDAGVRLKIECNHSYSFSYYSITFLILKLRRESFMGVGEGEHSYIKNMLFLKPF